MDDELVKLDAAWLRLVGLLMRPRGKDSGSEQGCSLRAALMKLEEQRLRSGLPNLERIVSNRPVQWN